MIRSLVEASSLADVRTCHSSLPRISSERFGRGGKSGAIGGEGLRTFYTPGKVAGEGQSTLIPPEGPGLGRAQTQSRLGWGSAGPRMAAFPPVAGAGGKEGPVSSGQPIALRSPPMAALSQPGL